MALNLQGFTADFRAGPPFPGELPNMLDTLRLWILVARLPGLVPGAALHRAGLRALHAGELESADRLFDLAALQYGRELRVEPIARARVHQQIARARQSGHLSAEFCLEVERRLYRLPLIERLEPPFELTDARELLALWTADGVVSGDVAGRTALARAA